MSSPSQEFEAELRVALAEGILSREEADVLRDEALRSQRSPLELLRERKRLSEDTFISLKVQVRDAAAPEEAAAALSKTRMRPDAPTLEPAPRVPPAFPVAGWERYTCVRFLGQGGMGRVFLAEDPRLRRFVALKFVRDDEPEHTRRFIAEARAQARVNHEHVCKVYEVGEVEGKVYIAMQYIDGQPLDVLAGELTVEQKVMVLRDAAEGVHEAHRVGLIHRDIKPSNVMVERTGDGRLKPYVMDFGLARDWKGGGTVTGSVMGTPHYMAPEQARGEVSTLDRRVDVYSLGASLYSLLTGQPPIPGGNALEVLTRIPTEEPRPPRALNPNIPVDLEAIALKCLEKDRSARYDSARAFADELERFLSGEPVRARSAGLGYRLRKRLRKHRAIASVAAAALLAVVLALGWAGLQRREANLREHLARRFTELVERVEARARYSDLTPLHDTRPDHAELRARMDELEAEIRQGGERAMGPGYYALGRGYLALGDTERARESLESAWSHGFQEPRAAYALAVVLGQLYRDGLLEAERIRAPESRERRKQELQRRYREPALAYLQRSEGAEVPSVDYVAALLAFYEDRLDDALARLDSLGTSLRWFYEAPKLRGDILVARASRRWNQGDREGARADFEAGRQAYAAAAAIGESVPSVHQALGGLEYAALQLELYGQGDLMPHVTRGQEAVSRALTADPGHLGSTLLEAAFHRRLAEYRIDRGEDAREQQQQALAAAQRALELAPTRREALLELGMDYWQWGEYLKARNENPREPFQKSVELLERIGPEQRDYDYHYNLGLTFRVWASYEDQVGGDSLPYRDRAIASFRAAIAVDERLPHAWMSLGGTYLARASHPRNPDAEHDLEQARIALDKARSLNPQHVVPWFDGGQVHEQRARLYRARGQDARPELDTALALYRKGLELGPDVRQLHNSVASVLLQQAEEAWSRGGDPFPLLEQAREAYARALALAPNRGFAHHNLSEVHVQRAAYQVARGEDPGASVRTATAVLREALARIPEAANPWANLGMAHALQATFELEHGRDPGPSLARASEALRNALARNPRDAQSLRYLAETRGLTARTLARRGRATARDFEEAARAFQDALEAEPGNQSTRVAFGHFCREWAGWRKKTGQEAGPTLERGLSLAEEVLAARPGWADARLLRARLLLGLAEGASEPEARRFRTRALEDSTRALETNPNLERRWKDALR